MKKREGISKRWEKSERKKRMKVLEEEWMRMSDWFREDDDELAKRIVSDWLNGWMFLCMFVNIWLIKVESREMDMWDGVFVSLWIINMWNRSYAYD